MHTPSYEELIASGQSSSIAQILSSRRPPGVHGTDTTAFAGFGSLNKQLGKDCDRIVTAAKKHGYNPCSHDVYNPTFATFEGDPAAFSSQGQGLARYTKLAESRGLAISGDKTQEARIFAPKPKVKKLSQEIITRKLSRMAKENPDILRADRREVIQGIVDKHAL
jgi:hypothetical protein